MIDMYADHRGLNVLTPSSPSRRSSDLKCRQRVGLVRIRGRAPVAAQRRVGLRTVMEEAIAGGGEPPHHLRACFPRPRATEPPRSEEHTSELQSLMRISYAVFCLYKQ